MPDGPPASPTMPPTLQISELTKMVDECVADIDSEEAQRIINSNSHVLLCWDDGELTSTKASDLFGHRSLHGLLEAWLPRNEQLWEVPESPKNPFTADYEAKVVTDREKLFDIFKTRMDEMGVRPRGYERL